MTSHSTAGALPFRTAADVEAAVPKVVAHLRRDGVLAHPTETVYGLGCRLTADALSRLRELKGRGEDKPFVVLVAGLGFLESLGLTLQGAAADLARTFWPGALTLVLPSRAALPTGVQRDDGAVAVRWTSHAGLQRLISATDAAITSTSANRAGLPTVAATSEIVREWPGEIVRGELMVLDGGPAGGGSLPSTIVDCTGDAPSLARSGAVSATELRRIVPGLGGAR
jgi:L-threonylcarbamoyladenylate synthase